MFSTQQTINSYSKIATSFQICDFVSMDEVLVFLNRSPEKNSILSSLIIENGLINQIGNGQFTTYQNLLGNIEGLALIGEKVFFNAASDSALEFFAEMICKLENKAFALCDTSQSVRFYEYLKQQEKDYIVHCEEILMVLDSNYAIVSSPFELEIATHEHLGEIVRANSEIMLSERGYNPLDLNPDRFIKSYAKLIDQKRCLISILDGEIACKVDLAMNNSLVTYFEGFYVNPKLRRQGVGFSFLQSVIAKFHHSSKYLSLLVDNKNTAAVSLYEKSGFKEVIHFSVSTIFPDEIAS
jgi:ribosomal protein S18 acetylase RimI-like enzyme